jgi:hypothetical protein
MNRDQDDSPDYRGNGFLISLGSPGNLPDRLSVWATT